MAIAALLLWVITTGAGVYLLMTTISVRRARIGSPAVADLLTAGAAPPTVAVPSTPTAGSTRMPGGGPGAAVPAAAAGPADGTGLPADPPPIPRVRVRTGPDDHPLLEFMHPALAIAGLGAWLGYVATRYPAFAWVSFSVLILTIGAGLGWLTTSARSAKRRRRANPGAPRVPAHLIILHGLGASTTFVLAVLTVLTVIHI